MTIYQPYTYLIGWSKQDKWYYGVRYANKVSPDLDLWKEYFTSSNYVTEFRKIHGEPDVVTIDKIFDDVDSAVAYETQYLVENEVLGNTKWINKNAAGAVFIDDECPADIGLWDILTDEQIKRALSSDGEECLGDAARAS